MRIPGKMMPHRRLVAYKPYLGETGRGSVYGDEVVAQRANIQEQTEVLTTGLDQTEVSRASIWLDPEHAVPNGSLVRVWAGTGREFEATVRASTYWDQGGALPEHVVIKVV